MRTWAGLALDRPLTMGVLNITPDSFSDGGAYLDAETAIAAGLAMREAGADIVDVGGESTRPGAAPVPADEEARRVLPVIHRLADAGVLVSADTRNAATMRAALAAGARVVNDVSALRHDLDSAAVLAASSCGVVLMHMRGTPATMAAFARYEDVVAEVAGELAERARSAEAAGIARERIVLDPGFGFAKLATHSVELLCHLEVIVGLGFPVLVGVSRKRFLGRLSGEADPARRDPASLAAALFAVSRGASLLRVHNVAATKQAVAVWHSLQLREKIRENTPA